MRALFVLLVGSLLAACQAPVDASTSTSSTSSTSASDEGTTTLATGTTTTTTTGATGPSSGGSTSDDPTTAAATSDASTRGEATSDASTTEDASSTGTSGTTGVEPKTCKKVDILFLIDDGAELWGTATALKKLMPHLAARLEGDFADWDYHLMVIKGEESWGNKYCDEVCGTDDACDPGPIYPCDYEPTTCDRTLGAGLTFPAGGAYAANVPCPIDGGRRYVASGQHDLAGTLDCLRQVGGGYDKKTAKYRVVRATLDALSDDLNAPGACNEGFLRDDAYLILFLVEPFPDYYSPGTSADWTKELKGHKGGKFDKIYFVGLYQGCESGFGWKEYEPLNEWTESLYYHHREDACIGDLIPIMDPALDYVLGDCQE